MTKSATPSHLLPVFARADVGFERGEGAWLVSTDGERYLDFTSGVAVNALGILEREARLGPSADAAEHARLVELLGRDGTLAGLNRELARQLRVGERDERDPAVMAHLEATIADKIAIANPKWR